MTLAITFPPDGIVLAFFGALESDPLSRLLFVVWYVVMNPDLIKSPTSSKRCFEIFNFWHFWSRLFSSRETHLVRSFFISYAVISNFYNTHHLLNTIAVQLNFLIYIIGYGWFWSSKLDVRPFKSCRWKRRSVVIKSWVQFVLNLVVKDFCFRKQTIFTPPSYLHINYTQLNAFIYNNYEFPRKNGFTAKWLLAQRNHGLLFGLFHSWRREMCECSPRGDIINCWTTRTAMF